MALLASVMGVDAAPQIRGVVPMDRWIDLNWDYSGSSPGGFVVEMSRNGHDFTAEEQVEPEARSASVFVEKRPFALFGWGGKLHLRVAAIDAAGHPGEMSESVSVRPAKPRDIEAEIRGKFGYWEKRSSYNADDPAYTVIYTEAQKQQQRQAALTMFAELQQAATNPAAPRQFTIPQGTYRVEPGQMALKGVSNFTIHASGVEIIVDSEKSGAAFVFNSCTNVTLTGRAGATSSPEENVALITSFVPALLQAGTTKARARDLPLIIDSEQLPMSVARILSRDITQRTLDVEILPGYVTNLPEAERMMAYNPKGKMVNIAQMGWKSIAPLGGRKFRLKTPSLRNPLNQQTVLVPGNLLALHNAAGHGVRSHGACSSEGSRNMTFESIRVYNGGGSPADHGTAGHTVYRDWRLFPRPGTSRLPIATGLGQFSKNGGSFLFENCEFGPHLDDGVNLLSGMSIVGRQESQNTVIVTGGQKPTVGSTLTFYDYTNWINFGEAKVVASELITDTNTLAEVNAFAKKNRTVQKARIAFRTVLDRPVKLSPFAMVVYSDYRADSIVVRGCLFRDQLAQIMLLQGAKRGLIENNLLLRSTGGGISAQFSQYWWEGPMPSNFMIRNNVIRDNPVAGAVTGFAGNGSIAVYAGTKYPCLARLLTDFRIEGNLIINPSVYGIVIRNADRVVIRHNVIVNPGAVALEGIFNGRPFTDLYAAICLDAVSHVTVTDNKIIFGNPRCQKTVLMETNCDAATVRIERNR